MKVVVVVFAALTYTAIIIAGIVDSRPLEVAPGNIQNIPGTKNIAVGTDTAIVIVNKETGAVIQTIIR